MGGFYNNASAAVSSQHHYGQGAHHYPGGVSKQPQQSACYHYNPYDAECSRVPIQHQYQAAEASQPSTLPYGTLHTVLEHSVSFVPYPTEEFHPPVDTTPSENMARVFIGQLPYQVTDMQLNWLIYTFGAGGVVHYPERITKHDPMRGCKVPTGCIHAYCDAETATEVLGSMHKRLLVDDTGVWYAETPEQQQVLTEYCQMMKLDRSRRYQNRPYDTVVAQFATSTYVPTKRR